MLDADVDVKIDDGVCIDVDVARYILALRVVFYSFTRIFLASPLEHGRSVYEVLGASRVCLHCWHRHRQLVEESETHMLLECPLLGAARDELIMTISTLTFQALADAACNHDRLMVLLGSQIHEDWNPLGRFLGRARQAKRKSIKTFQKLEVALRERGFYAQRAAWRAKGQHVCRHVVFFRLPCGSTCPCMLESRSEDLWEHAMLMPAMDHELKALVVTPFCLDHFSRLAVLQAEARRLDW